MAAADSVRLGMAVSFYESDAPAHTQVNQSCAALLRCSPGEAVQRVDRLVASRQIQGRIPDGLRFACMEQVWNEAPCTLSFLAPAANDPESDQAESRFRLLVESAPDGLTMIQDGKFVFVNQAAARMFGYTDAEQVIGLSMEDVLEPDDALKARRRVARLRAGSKPSDSSEYRGRTPEGQPLVIEIASILSEYRGTPAVLGFARDVTERRQFQSQLVQSDRLAAVGTLAAGVAHEINNPLAYVMLNLEYLERELPKVCPDEPLLERLLERARDARHGVDRVATIVRDLRLFARPTEGITGPVDLIGVIEAAIRIARNEIRHYAELVRRYEPVPKVTANAARLEQVFLNLLVNATHAVRERRERGGRIEVHVRQQGPSEVLAEVRDNGPGMSQAVLDRIFLPFFTTKAEDVGTGLGLAICRSIVDSLHGTLAAQSEVGRGTTFRVSLPVQAALITPLPRAPLPPPSSQARVRTRRLLVIDDEPAMAKTLQLLVEGDYDVVACQSVAEGLKLLDSNERFDVILCDLMMPKTTGADFYEMLEQRGSGLERSVVFMTAGAFGERAEAFVSSVDNPVLDKPFQLRDLEEALERSLLQSQPVPVTERR